MRLVRFWTLITLVLGLAAGRALSATASTWTDAGATHNWSDPTNWSPIGIPPDGSALTFPGGTVNQDVDPPLVTSITFSRPTTISGGPIEMIDGIIQSAAGAGPVRIDSQLQLHGQSFVDGGGERAFGFQLSDVAGSGTLTITSDTAIGHSTYTGTTVVQGGAGLYITAANFLPATTSGQGDYQVNGTLGGEGTIGLAPGKRILIAGTLLPVAGRSPEPDPSTLTINGTLAFGAGGVYQPFGPYYQGPFLPPAPGSNVVVNGLLDLSGAGDKLLFSGPPAYPEIVMHYESRVGQFDDYIGPPGTSVDYTSDEGAGPGDVVIVPEPTIAAVWILVISFRRSR